MTRWERLLRAPLLEVGAYRPGPSLDALRARRGLDAVDKLNWNEGLASEAMARAAAARLAERPEVLAAEAPAA